MRSRHSPRPQELWDRLRAAEGLGDQEAERLLTPAFVSSDRRLRYYQEIAINRDVQAILQGRRRVLLTMATGTGKTVVAFQICWKLWYARWNRTGEHRATAHPLPRRPQHPGRRPEGQDLRPFGDARCKIEGGEAVKSREMYFAIYQAIAKDERPARALPRVRRRTSST